VDHEENPVNLVELDLREEEEKQDLWDLADRLDLEENQDLEEKQDLLDH